MEHVILGFIKIRKYYLKITKKRMSCKPTDDQLRSAIEGIFNKYDTDKSGTLE